jgi:hypothetical protein
MRLPFWILGLALLPFQEDLERRLDALLPRLAEESLEAREAAVVELVSLGEAALPLLRNRAGGAAGEIRARLLDAVHRIETRSTLAKYLPPLRSVTLDFKNRPAREAFEEIARQGRFPLEVSEGAAAAAVSLSLKAVPPLEALDAACSASGCSWRVDQHFYGIRRRRAAAPPAEGPRVQIFSNRAPAYPSSVVRHYRFSVQSVTLSKSLNFNATQRNANLGFQAAWLPDVNPDRIGNFRLLEMVDDQGRSLLPTPQDAGRSTHFGYRRPRSYVQYQHQESVPFRYPEADAVSIARLKGILTFSYPSEVRTLVFERPAEAAGKSLEVAGAKVTLNRMSVDKNSLTLHLDVVGGGDPNQGSLDERLPFSHEDVQVVSESGDVLDGRGMSGSGNGQSYSWELRYELPEGAAVKLIRIPCVLKTHTDDAAFEIKDIPLPR